MSEKMTTVLAMIALTLACLMAVLRAGGALEPWKPSPIFSQEARTAPTADGR